MGSPPLYLAQVTNPSVIQEHQLTETSTRKRYQSEDVLISVDTAAPLPYSGHWRCWGSGGGGHRPGLQSGPVRHPLSSQRHRRGGWTVQGHPRESERRKGGEEGPRGGLRVLQDLQEQGIQELSILG